MRSTRTGPASRRHDPACPSRYADARAWTARRLRRSGVSRAGAPPRRRSARPGRGRPGPAAAGRCAVMPVFSRHCPSRSTTSATVPDRPFSLHVRGIPADRERAPRRPRRRRGRRRSVWATERTSSAGSRPIARHAASTRANCAATFSSTAKGTLNSVGEPGGERGRPLRAVAADDHRRVRLLHRLGQRRRVRERVVRARVGEPLPRRRPPQPGDDLQLLGEPVEPLAAGRGTGCRRPRARPSNQPEPSPSSTRPPRHGVDLRHRDRERAGQPERRRGDQRAQPDPRGLPGERRRASPRSRSGPARPDASPIARKWSERKNAS